MPRPRGVWRRFRGSGSTVRVRLTEVRAPAAARRGGAAAAAAAAAASAAGAAAVAASASESAALASPGVHPVRYALTEAETSESTRADLEAFWRFMTVPFFGAVEEPIRKPTATAYVDRVRCALGWLKRFRGVADPGIGDLLPSAGKEGAQPTFAFLTWLDERGCASSYQGHVLKSTVKLAKFWFHETSQADVTSGDKAYEDIPVLKVLRMFAKSTNKRTATALPVADESLKWIDWPTYLACVRRLREECSEITSTGGRRSPLAVARSFQAFLIFAILSCVPDRQRTIRELRVGKTLVKDARGSWTIRHGPDDYKTGKTFGPRPPMLIARQVVPYLEEFIDVWRAFFKPKHDFLFCARNGEPATSSTIYSIFTSNMFRLTGKRPNPHMVRDMIVTHLRSSDASERELEALALLMGHSVAMQKETYDKRTKEQKVSPAVKLIARIRAGSLPDPEPMRMRDADDNEDELPPLVYDDPLAEEEEEQEEEEEEEEEEEARDLLRTRQR